MKPSRVLLSGVLLILASALPARAHASPPDPSWIPGMYDDADLVDDVVTLVVKGTTSYRVAAPSYDFVEPRGAK
jgi:hypothetical protein